MLAMHQQEQTSQAPGHFQGQTQQQIPTLDLGVVGPSGLGVGRLPAGLLLPAADIEFQRRWSVPHPLSSIVALQDAGYRMSAIDFNTAPDAFSGFTFSPASNILPDTTSLFPHMAGEHAVEVVVWRKRQW